MIISYLFFSFLKDLCVSATSLTHPARHDVSETKTTTWPKQTTLQMSKCSSSRFHPALEVGDLAAQAGDAPTVGVVFHPLPPGIPRGTCAACGKASRRWTRNNDEFYDFTSDTLRNQRQYSFPSGPISITALIAKLPFGGLGRPREDRGQFLLQF